MDHLALQLGTVFLVGFILPIVPVFPVRLIVLIPLVSATVDPIAVVLSASIGSCLGTLPIYGLAVKAKERAVVDRWMRRRWVQGMLRALEGRMFLTVVLFALLPLPDQLMSAIGGLKRYPAGRMALGFFIGRLPYYSLLAYIGSTQADAINSSFRRLLALLGI